MRISYNSNLFRFIIIFTACLCTYFAIQKKKPTNLKISSNFEIPTDDYSISGHILDKLPNEDEVIKLFQQWKKEHGRVYNDLEELSKKFGIFVSNLKYITERNAKRESPHSSVLGLTNFADLSFTEFKETYMPVNFDTMDIEKNNDDDDDDDEVDELTCNASNLPSSLDWRVEGAVTPVKDQGSAGCCWAFSTVGAIEGIVQIVTKKYLSLSNQELLDCEPNGTYRDKAFDWVKGNNGLAPESEYPYTGKKGDCRSKKIRNSPTSGIDSYRRAEAPENGLLCAVAKQPLSVGIDATTQEYQHYKVGIFQGQDCLLGSTFTNHAMLIVGYGFSKGEDFWIVKNSHGQNWGMRGYMYIQRNARKKYGVCGINLFGIYPIKNK